VGGCTAPCSRGCPTSEGSERQQPARRRAGAPGARALARPRP
jgi:hypothetical protein